MKMVKQQAVVRPMPMKRTKPAGGVVKPVASTNRKKIAAIRSGHQKGY